MLQGIIVKAYKTLLKLSNANFNPKTAYKLYRLRQELTPAWNFQIEEERKIINSIPHKDDIQIVNLNENPEVRQKLTDLANVEVTISDTCYPIKMNISELPDLSVEDFESLQPFIEFEE